MNADLRSRLQSTLGAAYTLERELGGGGMSHVFVAEETALHRKVVVKVVPPEVSGGVNVEGDLNGDGVADFNIVVDGVPSLVGTDFVL